MPAGLDKMVDLSIIIVSYNTRNLLRDCFFSIEKHKPKGLNYEVIVVDNGSSDGSAKEIENLRLKIKNLRAIFNQENLGFARANNQGIKAAKGDFILLLNSDTEVLDDALLEMVRFMKKKAEVGVVGGKIMNFDGALQPSIGKFLSLGQALIWLLGGERLGLLRKSPNKTQEADWVMGACLMTRKEVLNKVGLLDENFFMYLEEMEWCYRVKKAGFSVYFYPRAGILHKGLASGNRERAIVNIYKGLLYFYRKHKNYGQYMIVKLLLVIKAYIAIAIGILTRNRYLASTYRKALTFSFTAQASKLRL